MSTIDSHGVKSLHKVDLLIEWSVGQRIRALAKTPRASHALWAISITHSRISSLHPLKKNCRIWPKGASCRTM